MSNPRRLLEHVKESQNLVLDGKTRSTVNTNMADKQGEAQETPSIARIDGPEPSSLFRRPSPGLHAPYLYLNSDVSSQRTNLILPENTSTQHEAHHKSDQSNENLKSTEETLEQNFQSSKELDKLKKSLKDFEESKPQDPIDIWQEKILLQETVLAKDLDEFEENCLELLIPDFTDDLQSIRQRLEARKVQIDNIISSYQSSAVESYDTSIDLTENEETGSESPEVEAYLARNELIIAAEGLEAGPILPEDLTACISALAGMIVTIKKENTEQKFSFEKYLNKMEASMLKVQADQEKRIKANSDLIKLISMRLSRQKPHVQAPAKLPTFTDQMQSVRREMSQASPSTSSPSVDDIVNGVADRLTGSFNKSNNDPALVKYQTDKIRIIASRIKETLQKHDLENSQKLANKQIRDYYTLKLKIVSDDATKLDSAAEQFLKKGNSNDALITEAQLQIASANSWCSRVTELYIERGLNLKVDHKQLLDTIPVFSCEGKTTIYEFLKIFDDVTSETLNDKQKAHLLYSKHISNRLKADLHTMSDSFTKMRAWLLEKFGVVRGIIDRKINPILAEKHPDEQSQSSLSEYYRIVHLQLKEIANLHLTSNLPEKELFDHIHKVDFVQFRILTFLPESFSSIFIEEMEKEGWNFNTIEGMKAFMILLDLTGKLSRRSEQLNQILCKNKNKKQRPIQTEVLPKPKQTVHSTQQDSKKLQSPKSHKLQAKSPVVNTNNSQQSKPKKSSPASSTQKSPKKGNGQNSKKKQWYDSNIKFPCPIADHVLLNHDIGNCEQFFKSEAVIRKAHASLKLCFTCLGPRDQCQGSSFKCGNMNLPQILTCKHCKFPMNVLLCSDKSHKKPSVEDIVEALEEWIPNFKSNAPSMRSFIKATANIVAITHACICGNNSTACACDRPKSLTRAPVPEEKPPVFNVTSGEVLEHSTCKTLPEAAEDSIYLFQTFMFGSEEVTGFFDSGANAHLIKGDIAELLKLKVLSDDNMSLGTVGGSRIWTNYGLYSLSIGPDTEGNYHELIAQGIDTIMKKLPVYPLKSVNDEVIANEPAMKEVLPEFAGGEIKLLIGIKSSPLSPKLIFSLPGGLGVYASSLRDKWGSRIIYGGPHKIFTQFNYRNGMNFHHIQVMLSGQAASYRESVYPIIRMCTRLDDQDDTFPSYDVPYMLPVMGKNREIVSHIYPGAIPRSTYNDLNGTCCREVEDALEEVLIDHVSIPCEGFGEFSAKPLSLSTDSSDTAHYMDVHETPSEQDCNPCEVIRKSSTRPLSLSTDLPNDYHSLDLQNICPSNNSCCKLSLVQKQKKLIDEEDIDDVISYRCSDCAKCLKCQQSNRMKTLSLQEVMEQEVIEKSVTIDLEQSKVFVDLPFIKDPDEFMIKRHGGDNNYKQALPIYKSQCKKADAFKDGIRTALHDLQKKGFVVHLNDLPKDTQTRIRTAKFKHYLPWATALKDSITTPVRIVVNPSASGLNLILAKGQNHLGSITDILLGARCDKFIWTADISKLYNCLFLNEQNLQYNLFLYSDELDVNKPPEIWVILRGWYGLTSTGNQTGVAISKLFELLKAQFPKAEDPVLRRRYVDDLVPGAHSIEEREDQIADTVNLLKNGGFEIKFVAKSGSPPPENASTDGKNIHVLGYSWETEGDTLKLGIGELNFQKKVRGLKKKNPFPVVTPEDVRKILSLSSPITRKVVTSKIAEIFDPLGLWEPYKLQLKIELSTLNGRDWDDPLSEEEFVHWKERFEEFLELPKLKASRCVIPSDASEPLNMRLLVVCDAAEYAGGAALYATVERKNGQFSSQLLIAKSKLLKHSIPRNELSAILVGAELGYLAHKSLGSKVKSIYFFTDSTISLCWVHNTSLKLRMYTFNRVCAIRRFIRWTIQKESELPLFHIDGEMNIADLLTKPNGITPKDTSLGSLWQTGYAWQTAQFEDMPITRFSDLTVSRDIAKEADVECFPEISAFHLSKDSFAKSFPVLNEYIHCEGCLPRERFDTCIGVYESSHCYKCQCSTGFVNTDILSVLAVDKQESYLVPLVSFGWEKACRILGHVLNFTHSMIHKLHQKPSFEKVLGEKLSSICMICKVLVIENAQKLDASQANAITRSKKNQLNHGFLLLQYQPDIEKMINRYLYLKASNEIIHELGKDKALKKYTESDGILYYSGRLSKMDPVEINNLEHSFYDNTTINPVVPVVLASSPIAYSYALHCHLHVAKHYGVETVYNEVSKVMHIINGRRLISQIRIDCTKCRILLKQRLELEMQAQKAERTCIAPVFFNIQIDIAMGFKAKPFIGSRKSIKAHAIVIVCLMSSATSIHLIEDLSTASVVQALERHVSRYGYPFGVVCDSGSNLVKLADVQFSIRDVNLTTHPNMGFQIKVCTPKAHYEVGRVEAKVKLLKEMLTKLTNECDRIMTFIGWETMFMKIANMLDNLPMCKVRGGHNLDWEIITPNRLKLGRNNYRSMSDSPMELSNCPQSILERNRLIQAEWYKIFISRIHHLIPQTKWNKSDEVKIGDIVLFIFEDGISKKLDIWKLGRVENIEKGKLLIKYTIPSSKTPKTIFRKSREVSKILSSDDLGLNTVEHFQRVSNQT